MCADVTALDLKIPEASADIVFSNWLLMYLSDDEVETTPIPPPKLYVCVSLWLKHYVLQTVCFLLTGNQSVLWFTMGGCNQERLMLGHSVLIGW
jgi:hypothetical protein